MQGWSTCASTYPLVASWFLRDRLSAPQGSDIDFNYCRALGGMSPLPNPGLYARRLCCFLSLFSFFPLLCSSPFLYVPNLQIYCSTSNLRLTMVIIHLTYLIVEDLKLFPDRRLLRVSGNVYNECIPIDLHG